MRGATALALGVLAAALASMIVFAFARGRAPDEDARRKGRHFLLGAGDFLLHWLLWAVSPLERALLRAGATPDHLNLAGLAFGLAAGALIALGRLEAGGWAIVLAGLCDILDGRLARARGLVSPYGAFIDSTLDRFVESAVFVGLAVHYARWPGAIPVIAAALAGSLLVSYTQARGEAAGVSGSGGLMQRAERVVLVALGCLVDSAATRRLGWESGSILLALVGVVAVGSLATAVHRTVWIARRLRR
jgi:phosphatidylglycerophosphate synthase